MSSHPVAADSGLSLLSAPDQLQLNDDFRGGYMSSSPSLSPLACKYESRLRAPSTKRQRTRPPLTFSSENGDQFIYSDFRIDTSLSLSSRSLFSLPSDRESWSTRSDTAALFRFNSGRSSTCHSDRFIPSRMCSSDSSNSFNLSDRYNHSPLSLMRKKRKRSKSVDITEINITSISPDGDQSDIHKKYDECLQSVLLPQYQSSGAHVIPSSVDQENRNYHLQECPLSNCTDDGVQKSQESESQCICDYILKERHHKIDSPKKVLRFNYTENSQGDGHGEDMQSISCLPDSVKCIMQSDKKGNCTSTKPQSDTHQTSKVSQFGSSGVTIPSGPIRSVDLDTMHRDKQLANDYYYHLMDFKMNQKLGCIALKDSLHLIRGHFGDLEDAEDNRPIRVLNKDQKVRRSEYHFCSVKLSPNQNVLCLGDNAGRLLFYDYCRQKFVHSIYKRNRCRISVLDWRNHFNSSNGIIAAGSLDKTIRVYDDRTYGQCYKLRFHKGEVCGLRWNESNEHLLLSGGNQNAVCCWDIRKKRQPLFVGRHKAAIRALTWYPHSDTMFISGGGSNDQAIKIWDTGCSGAKLSLLTGSQVCNVECLEYHNEQYLVSSHGFSSNSILIWNMKRDCNPNNNSSEVSLTRIKQLCGHKCRVLYLCKYSDSNVVTASAGPDQTLKYWKIFPSQMESPFMHHIQNIIR